MLTALIVDDEPLAHRVILHHLQNYPDVGLVEQCYGASEALIWLAKNSVDILFLDINMPELNGIELLEVLANRPHVVIVSAYPEYALRGFDLDVVDYLLKPVNNERLSQALDKVRARARSLSPKVPKPDHVVLKVDREMRKFLLTEIVLLEAYGNYVILWTREDKAMISSSLKGLVNKLPSQRFTQVHKSYVVNNEKISGVGTGTITLDGGRTVKTGKSFRKQVQRLL